jgi:hypothetical protein
MASPVGFQSHIFGTVRCNTSMFHLKLLIIFSLSIAGSNWLARQLVSTPTGPVLKLANLRACSRQILPACCVWDTWSHFCVNTSIRCRRFRERRRPGSRREEEPREEQRSRASGSSPPFASSGSSPHLPISGLVFICGGCRCRQSRFPWRMDLVRGEGEGEGEGRRQEEEEQRRILGPVVLALMKLCTQCVRDCIRDWLFCSPTDSLYGEIQTFYQENKSNRKTS